MNAHIKSYWLTVLASKAFACSGNGRLVTPPTDPDGPPSYSALGVLRELAIEAGVPAEPPPADAFSLPPAVAAWAEMDTLPWMLLAKPSGIHNLAYINKLGSGTFDLEAAAIKEHL